MEIIENKLLKEKIYEQKYKCGLVAYVMPKAGYDKKYAIFSTHFGSINDKFLLPDTGEEINVPDGVAHFLEHKLFSQKDGNAMDMFAAMGTESNAYTSFNHTAYLFSCTEGFDESFKLLLKFVQNPYITEESVENEKGIIGQEIRMYEDDPDWQLYFNFINCLYNNHPIKKDIAGTKDTISHIDKEMLYKCFNTFYDLSNMVIFVVGDVAPEEVFSIIEENAQVNKEPVAKNIIKTKEEEKIFQPQKEIELDVSIPMFMLGFKINDKHEDILKDEIAITIALEMLCGKSSDLYQKLYEEGLITSPFDIDVTFEREYSFIAISGESEKIDEVVKRLRKEIESFKTEELDIEVFNRIKRRLTGGFIRQFNSVGKIAHSFISNIMRDVNLLDYLKIYNDIGIDDIEKVIGQYLDEEYMAISKVKPGEN